MSGYCVCVCVYIRWPKKKIDCATRLFMYPLRKKKFLIKFYASARVLLQSIQFNSKKKIIVLDDADDNER